MGDLFIKGGRVVDGTGAPGRVADIRVRNGRIAEIGANLRPDGERVIDASGAIVTPGFIDSHTHYDATVYWDPMCDPMPQHGVTTVMVGNCSLSLAPIHATDRAGQVDTYSYIEDMPLEVLTAAIPWTWEDFGEYAQAMSAHKLGVNLMSFVGHSQIRSYVMGDAAWERAATVAEVKAIAAELDRALAAGAWGLSFSLFDKDRKGRWVPSVYADDAEMDALCATLARHSRALQFVVSGDTIDIAITQLEKVGRFVERHKIVGLWNAIFHLPFEPERSVRQVECLKAFQARGVRIYALASPRPFEMSIGFDQSLCFNDVPAWNEVVQGPLEQKRRLTADAAWRDRARTEADERPSVMFPFKRAESLRISSVNKPDLQSWVGKSLAELRDARGGHVSDVLADWVIENDFKTTFSYATANIDPVEVAALLKSPATFVSGSDAGAHLQMFSAAGDGTLLLTKFVRERGDYTLEEAVHTITGHQAEVLGIKDRGVIAPGKAADFAIFALDELRYESEYQVNDLPGGRPRLTRAAGGYRYTIVNGVVVQEAGKATGDLPARWLGAA